MLHAPPTARFIVRGQQPLTIEVEGRFDAAAAVGFRALVPTMVGDRDVVIDLTACDLVDGVAELTVDRAVRRIRLAGGRATLRRWRGAEDSSALRPCLASVS
jgi:anti-anti-sigma regulatory factor